MKKTIALILIRSSQVAVCLACLFTLYLLYLVNPLLPLVPIVITAYWFSMLWAHRELEKEKDPTP